MDKIFCEDIHLSLAQAPPPWGTVSLQVRGNLTIDEMVTQYLELSSMSLYSRLLQNHAQLRAPCWTPSHPGSGLIFVHLYWAFSSASTSGSGRTEETTRRPRRPSTFSVGFLTLLILQAEAWPASNPKRCSQRRVYSLVVWQKIWI